MKRSIQLALLFLLLQPGALLSQDIYQTWVSSMDGALREYEFIKDSSLFYIRKVDLIQPREYYGMPQKMHFEILSQDEQQMRLLMKDLNTGTYALVRLFDWSSGSMRMFVRPFLESSEEAKAVVPPEGWGIRVYAEAGLAPIVQSKSPELIQEADYLQMLDEAIEAVEPLIVEENSPTMEQMRAMYLSSRLNDAIADAGFNIFDTEALNKVQLHFLEVEATKKRYAKLFKLVTGNEWE